MKQNLVSRVLTFYAVVIALESLLGIAVFLTRSNSAASKDFLGISTSTLILIIGLLVIFAASLFAIYWNGRTRVFLNRLLSLLENSPLFWNFFRWLVAGFLVSFILSILRPDLFDVYIEYYLRIRIIFILLAGFCLQTLVWLFIMRSYDSASWSQTWQETKYALGLEINPNQTNQNEIYPGRLERWLEAFVLCLLFAILFGVLTYFSGGPQSWDEMRYMYLSFHPEPDPIVLNRYFHIYLQKGFFWLAGNDPFLGVRLFWSFLIALTTVVTIHNAVHFSKRSHWLFGLIAMLFLFIQPRILPFAGVTYVDYTAMTLMSLALTCYLWSFRTTRYHRLFLFLLGLTIFFSYKSTDLGIFSILFVLGLGFSQEDDLFFFDRWYRNCALVLAGILAGQTCLMILDQIFLGDALFSVRLSSWLSMLEYNFGPSGVSILITRNFWLLIVLAGVIIGLSFYILVRKKQTRTTSLQKTPKSKFPALSPNIVYALSGGLALAAFYVPMTFRGWDYSIKNIGLWIQYLIPTIGIPFLLYFSSLIKPGNKRWKAYQVICWVLPIIYLVFIISFAKVSRRYFLPTLPIILVFGAQFFDALQSSSTIKGWLKTIVIIALPSFLVALIVNVPSGVALAILMVTIFAVKEEHPLTFALALTCMLLIVFPQIVYYGEPFLSGNQVRLFERRFSPLEASARIVTCSGDPLVFASPNYYREYGVLSVEQKTLRRMFNLFFRCTLDDSHFTQPGKMPILISDSDVLSRESFSPKLLLNGKYTYIYLTESDWDEFNAITKKNLSKRYQIETATWTPDRRLIDFKVERLPLQEIGHRAMAPAHLAARTPRKPLPVPQTLSQINKPIRMVFLYR